MYEEGRGVEKDLKKALGWYAKARFTKCEGAIEKCAALRLKGGTDDDEYQALKELKDFNGRSSPDWKSLFQMSSF
jgi:TPR repeat protein